MFQEAYFNRSKFTSILTCILIFAVVLTIYVISPVKTSYDSRWTVYIGLSILRDGDIDLSEYRDSLERSGGYGIEQVRGAFYSIFPVFPTFFALPAIAIYRVWLPEADVIRMREVIERVVASVLIAISAVLIYLTARIFLRISGSLIIVFIFAFCTPMWTTATRAMWSHTPSVLCLTCTLYLLVRAREIPSLIQWVAVPVALSYMMRPTNIVLVTLVTLYVLVYYRHAFLNYLVLGVLAGVLFLVFNFANYGSLLPSYYSAGRIGVGPHFGEALLANLVSPARGLFIFVPILLFAPYGMVLNLRDDLERSLTVLLSAILIVHWSVISAFPHWWAGHSFGPRFFSDMIPFLVFLLIPVVKRLIDRFTLKKSIAIAGFGSAVALSFWIHYQGATNPATLKWNTLPIDVDRCPARIWDWHDWQPMR